jgi:hypothetical protein
LADAGRHDAPVAAQIGILAYQYSFQLALFYELSSWYVEVEDC